MRYQLPCWYKIQIPRFLLKNPCSSSTNIVMDLAPPLPMPSSEPLAAVAAILSPASPPHALPLISLLDHCKSMQDFNQMYSQILRSGLTGFLTEQHRMISFCCIPGQGDMAYARLLFDEVPRPDHFICNTMIKGYSKNGSPYTAVYFYMEMLTRGIRPDDYTLPFLLKALDRDMPAELSDHIHAHVIKFGFCSNPHVQDALIHAYSINGATETARHLFDKSLKRNVVLWNAMISAYNRSKMYDESRRLFVEMEGLRIKPSLVTLVLVISACTKSRDLAFGAWIHETMDNPSVIPSLALQNALIDMYASCGDIRTASNLFENLLVKDVKSWTSMLVGLAKLGQVDEARALFDRMPDRDIVSWTAMIDGYIRANRFKEVLEIFQELQATGQRPDEFTMVSVLTACANLGALDVGEWIRMYMERYKIKLDVFVSNALIDLYSKCGCVEKAMHVFELMQTRDKFTWTAMISGLAVNGNGEKALELFTKMLRASVLPDGVTYVGVLSACAHAGLVDEGKEIFSSMINAQGIQPNVTHYGCLVDLLGRAGQLNDALETILSMPMKPNSRVWGALLGACRVHKDPEMAEFGANRILELEPGNGSVYVLLANIYAKCNKWEEVGRVKDMASQRGVMKVPGCSMIEVNGQIHEFVAGDDVHERSYEVYAKLEEMGRELKAAGYTPDTSEVVFDICEEEKEDRIYRHSEKLAIAFGLLSSGPGSSIRVIKNLRMCFDCHRAIKLISAIYNRVIVVRDKTRFHHFRSGGCSCKDYW